MKNSYTHSRNELAYTISGRCMENAKEKNTMKDVI